MSNKKEYNEFLPGIQGILSKNPSTFNLLIPIIFLVFFVSLILWLWFSEVDIISPSQAVILPNSRIKEIQSKEINVIEKIYVREGQKVKTGDILIQFQDKELKISYESNKDITDQLLLRKIALRAYLNYIKTGRLNSFKKLTKNLASGLESEIADEYQNYLSKATLYRQEKNLLKDQLINNKFLISKANLQLKKIKNNLNVQKKRYRNSKQLWEKKYLSKNEYNEVRAIYLNLKNEYKIALADVKANQYQYRITKKQANIKKSTTIFQTLGEIKGIEEQEVRMKGQKNMGLEQLSQKKLTSPINGIVNDLVIHTIGGVVQPAQVLMKIVPENSNLEVEAKVLNKDIGFIYLEQEVNVKIESFNFTKYGYLKGEVIKIFESSKIDQLLGPIFPVIIRLKNNFIKIDKKAVSLKPGMTATVDIKIGKRKLADYIIAPLLRYKDEALREK